MKLKYIVIGLGTFGRSIGQELMSMGHEVIGADKEMHQVETVKNDLTYTVCLDCTVQEDLSSLPLTDVDHIVIATAGNDADSLFICALLHKLSVACPISCRSTSPVHEEVLRAMGVTHIIKPDAESAVRWANKLAFPLLEDSMPVDQYNTIIRVILPNIYFNKTIADLGLNKKYEVLVLSIEKATEKIGLYKPATLARADTLLEKGDMLVVYGANAQLKRMLADWE